MEQDVPEEQALRDPNTKLRTRARRWHQPDLMSFFLVARKVYLFGNKSANSWMSQAAVSGLGTVCCNVVDDADNCWRHLGEGLNR